MERLPVPWKSDFDYSKDAVGKETSLSFSPFADETLNLIRDPGFFFLSIVRKGSIRTKVLPPASRIKSSSLNPALKAAPFLVT